MRGTKAKLIRKLTEHVSPKMVQAPQGQIFCMRSAVRRQMKRKLKGCPIDQFNFQISRNDYARRQKQNDASNSK